MTTLDPSTLDKLLEGVNPSDLQSLFAWLVGNFNCDLSALTGLI